MGTRSLTRVHDVWGEDRDEILINMYRQYDGYPEGHGVDLVEFLDGRVVGNGISMNAPEKFSNGAACLAAQLVANFKSPNEPGGFYLYPADAQDCGQDYEYDIFVQPNEEITVKVTDYRTVIFEGTVEEFKAFCLDPQEDEEN